MTYQVPCPEQDELRLEAVTTCVGFDDLLDITLEQNHPHFDTIIVVTAHDDKKTQACARKHGAYCVQTDLFKKNGRNFNKGAAINAGFGYYQYQGWRMHLDADIIVPDNFRRIIFNHSHLDKNCIYGADRVDVIGEEAIRRALRKPQHLYRALIESGHHHPIGARYVDTLNGYLPIGFFQLWHSSCQKDYPYSLGTAAHDDTLFSALWPKSCRHHLPSVVCYQLCARKPIWGENWDGKRRQPRIK